MSASKEARNQRAKEEPIYGIFFDGKKDKKTKVLTYDEDTGRYHPRVIQEEHYSVTWEPQGKYLCHFTPHKPGVGEKPAEMIAKGVYEWLCEREAVADLVLIRGDSTSTNTGCWGGAIVYLEKMVGHKCHWLVCWIHINELPLRHLIEKLDGPFIPRSGFTGPIGKLLHKIDDLEVNYSFKALPDTNKIRELPEYIVNQMSTDQKNCYKLLSAIQTGNLSGELAKIKCGPLNTSRWLTTAEALMMLWMRVHELTGEDLRKLEVLILFIINYYFKMFFDIKVQHHIKYESHHLITALTLLSEQSDEVQKIITPYIIRGAYSAHSENILSTLICSDDKEDRVFAVDKIMQIRAGAELGDKSLRLRRNPTVNLQATKVTDLIDWQKEKLFEPVFTCNMKLSEIQNIRESPYESLPYSIHTQSCERAVQEVSHASEAVFGQDRRDGFVRARTDHREIVPIFKSKKDILNIF